jgi:hypothetical protein
MAICTCGLPAHCCQPAVAAGIIYANLRGELNTTLAPQALFTQRSPVHEPLLQAFSFPSTLGEVTLHPLSQACLFIYSSHGKWVFPPPLWSFPPITTFTSFPAPDCMCCQSCLLRLACLYTAHVGSGLPPSLCWFVRDFPSPTLMLRAPHPLCYVSSLLLLLIIQFLLFSLGGGWSVQGAMLIWSRIVCGSTVYCLAHLVVHIFPSRLGLLSSLSRNFLSVEHVRLLEG